MIIRIDLSTQTLYEVILCLSVQVFKLFWPRFLFKWGWDTKVGLKIILWKLVITWFGVLFLFKFSDFYQNLFSLFNFLFIPISGLYRGIIDFCIMLLFYCFNSYPTLFIKFVLPSLYLTEFFLCLYSYYSWYGVISFTFVG